MSTPRLKSLRYSIYDGSAHAVMLGMGETFVMSFAVALGLRPLALGLVTALPVLLAATVQAFLFSRWRLPISKKKFVVAFAALQALLWIPIYFVPAFSKHKALSLIALLMLYHLTAHIISPVWNEWMGDLVNETERGQYYGRRNKYRAFFQLASFLLAGVILNFFEDVNFFFGFGLIFTASAAARLLSSFYISKMTDTSTNLKIASQFTISAFFKKSLNNNFGRFVVLVGLFLAATNIASPFFTAYQLRVLNFSYLELTLSMSMSLVFQFFCFQKWGIIGDRFGNLTVLKITTVLASVIPMLWLFTDRFALILMFQAFSGLVWSGFNLAAINYIFDAVQKQNLSKCTSFYNFSSNIGICIGASLGGLVSYCIFQFSQNSQVFSVSEAKPYFYMFFISGVLRATVGLFFVLLLKEVRKVESHNTWSAVRHFIGLSLTPEFSTRFVNIFYRNKK